MTSMRTLVTRFAERTLPAVLMLGLAMAPLAATNLSTSQTNKIALNWSGSVSELREYVADVEGSLHKRPFNRLNAEQKGWIAEQIELMREELDEGDDAEMSERLQRLASDFQTAIVQVEEGSLSCQHERRTGTRMVTQRCFSEQRKREDMESSQAQMRKWIRPAQIGGGSGPGS